MAGNWRARLKQAGVQADLAPPLCTPDGLARLRKLTTAKARPWLVAACGPEIHAGFFPALAPEARLPVVDVRSCPDLEAAVGAVILALETREQPEITTVPVCREVLVVGGGVGGCQAALDLANAGFKVYLAESSLSIGGTMAQLDKTFPTLDCSICILGPKTGGGGCTSQHRVAQLCQSQPHFWAGRELRGGSHHQAPLREYEQVRRLRHLYHGVPGDRAQPLEPGAQAPKMYPHHLRPGGAA